MTLTNVDDDAQTLSTREGAALHETEGRIDLSAVARELHEIAVRRGKYRDWSPYIGHIQICRESGEWEIETRLGHREHEANEIGDVLAVVLSIAWERGIDPAAALLGALERGRE